jgi:ATP-dependent Lhr-like helicase
MDLDGFLEILREIENGTLRTVAIDTPEPSVFCHEILNANPYAFLDDAPLEERRTRAVALRRTTRDDVDGAGILDPAAIAQVAAESWPVVRDADELHDALTTLIVVPPVAQWTHWFEELVSQRRAMPLVTLRPPFDTRAARAAQGDTVEFWACAERLEIARAAYDASSPAREEAVTEILRGWLESSGPMTVAEMAERLSTDDEAITAAASPLRRRTSSGVTGGCWRAFIV